MDTELPGRRRVEWPWQLPARGWARLAREVVAHISENHAFLVSAALAFYALMGLFPGLIALVSLYGLLADPQDVEAFVSSLAGLLPPTAWEMLHGELRALVEVGGSSLSLGFGLSLLGALWSVTSGVDALIEAVNWAYGTRDERSFLHRRGLSLRLTLGLIAVTIVAIGLVAVLPSVVALFRHSSQLLRLLDIARWPLLAALVSAGLLALYRLAPCRPPPARWVVSGALTASVLWLAISAGFSFYVSRFGTYHKTYGALAGVVVLLLWFYWSAFLVLLGAEITAALEAGKASPDAASGPAPGAAPSEGAR